MTRQKQGKCGRATDDFAKALLCYPSGLTYYRKIATELAEAAAAFTAAEKVWRDAPVDEDDAAAAVMWELEDTVKERQQHYAVQSEKKLVVEKCGT